MTNLQVLLDNLESGIEFPKSKSPIFVDDPIALACASYRIWQTTGTRWASLDRDLQIEPEDRVQATAIRRYYLDSMTMSALRGKSGMSEFRKKLYGILLGTHQIQTADLGILYRLPYFYNEDTTIDRVFENHEQLAVPFRDIVSAIESVKTFSLREKMLRSRRSAEYYHYWLRSTEDDFVYCFVVKSDNPLISIVDSMFVKREQTTVRCSLHVKQLRYRQEQLYYQLAGVELV